MNKYVTATDITILVDDLVMGCAQSATLKLARQFKNVVCAATGPWATQIPGQMSWDSSIGGITRAFTAEDAALNVTFDTLADKLVDGVLVTLEYSYAIPGFEAKRYRGNAYVSEVNWSRPEQDEVTWSANFTGDGPLNLKYTGV